MTTYASNGHPHYKKIEYQKTREEDEKDHASYAAIIEYSQMQEKLLVNLRQQLEKIRGVAVDNRDVHQVMTPSYSSNSPHSPSVTAFKNAAIAARKLPSQNSRNKQMKQIAPTILNPKRDYPRPWAMDKMMEQPSEITSDHNNFNAFVNNTNFRPTQYKGPQKQYYSPTMERHQPIPMNCGFHERFNIQSVCRNCQIPMMTDGPEHDGYFFPDQGNIHYEQYGNTQQIVPKIKGGVVPSGQVSNSRPWNNYYVTEEILNDNANTHFNSVVFPDPQAKRHPYLAKILEKTIPNGFNMTKAPIVTSRTQNQFKGVCQHPGGGGPVKVYNLLDMKQEGMFPSWGSRIENARPSVSLNVKVEESVHGGRKPQVVTKISSSLSIGQGERQDEMTLLPPRCILSSLSPVWSQASLQNKKELKAGPLRGSKIRTDSDSDDGKLKSVKGKPGKDKSGSLGPGRAVTYQVFTNGNKVLSEWDENKADEHGIIIENSLKQKDEFRRSRNAQSSGDESYGSMKVIRDSKEDFVKRIYEDFESYEDFDVAVDEKETVQKKKIKKREIEKSTVAKTEPIKAKDSRSLVRNQRLSFYKKTTGKEPIAKKSVSWTSQTNIQTSKTPYNGQQMWPPLVIDKMFPEVDKVLEEARGLSPFVDNLDKMLQSPPDLEKMIDNKTPWVSSKLTRFPTWFRDVDPITKLGEHLTIDKVFQIDIKPGQWKSSPLEEFITDSVGVFRGSKSSVCAKYDNSTTLARKTSQSVDEAKVDRNNNDESDTEVLPPVSNVQANDLAGKTVFKDINANIEISKMETLNKVMELGHAYAKTNYQTAAQKKKGTRSKSTAKIILPIPKLKVTPEETTILEKVYPEFPKLDRRQLKRLMDNPGSYTHFDGTIDTERLLKEGNLGKEFIKLSREKTPKDKKRTLQSATTRLGTSSKPRKKPVSKFQPPIQKNKI